MAMALKMFSRRMPLVLIDNPAGTWSFAGSVPAALYLERVDGAPVTDEDAKLVASHGLGLFKKTLRRRVWATKEAGIAAAEALGHKVDVPEPFPGEAPWRSK